MESVASQCDNIKDRCDGQGGAISGARVSYLGLPAAAPAEPMTAEEALARAKLLQREGQTAAAEDLYRTVLALDPDHPGALRELGAVRLQAGEFAEAAELISRAIERDPSSSSAHNNLGIALKGLDRPAEAAQHFEAALALDPKRPEAHYNLGQALQALGRLGEARACYERAIALRPDYSEAHNSLGVLLAPEYAQEALASFQRAVDIRPGFADGYNNMGNVLQDLGRHNDAIANYRRALDIKPDHPAQNNLGMALRELNRHEEAVSCFEMAQAIKPDYVDAHVNEGLVRLALGDYATGWKKYAWRRLTANFSQGRKNPPRPLWLGQWNVSGKTLLLHGEQGLGDTIQFCRYVPYVAQQGARIILAVQRPLASLMTGLAGVAVLRAQGETIPPFDGYCPLPSLPLAFKTTLESIPGNVPYLSAPLDRIERWRPIFHAIGRPRIGLMWAGAGGTAHNQRRSIPLELFVPLLQLADLNFIALQKELPDGDAGLLHSSRMTGFLGERQADLADTAAMISMLDLVITVDTSIAHLAGALGKPVWVLLPFSADWRWLRARNDSPWYPSARLFRQPAPGDWQDVVMQVERSLQLQRFQLPAGSGKKPIRS
jgi:tetratricopeptide (TPR) repeat protein